MQIEPLHSYTLNNGLGEGLDGLHPHQATQETMAVFVSYRHTWLVFRAGAIHTLLEAGSRQNHQRKHVGYADNTALGCLMLTAPKSPLNQS